MDGSRPGLEGFIPSLLRPINTAAAAVTRASSSPIQRTVTAIDGLLITQDIHLTGPDPRVDQRVALGSAYLRLSAAAAVDESAPARVRLCFVMRALLAPGLQRVRRRCRVPMAASLILKLGQVFRLEGM